MYPFQYVEVSDPAQWIRPTGSRSREPYASSVPVDGIPTGQPRVHCSADQPAPTIATSACRMVAPAGRFRLGFERACAAVGIAAAAPVVSVPETNRRLVISSLCEATAAPGYSAAAVSELPGIPFAELVGLEVLNATPALVRARLAWSPELCTTGGVMHGGAIMALADNSGGICAFLNMPPGAIGTATIESKTNFMRGVFSGSLTANTRPLHTGRTIAVLETELIRDDGKLAAKVTQTQAYHYPKG